MWPTSYLIWMCQRELQREIAKMSKEDENLRGNAALVMLFMLGIPLLCVKEVQEAEIAGQENQDGVREENALSSSSRDHSVDVSVRLWRLWTALAPQDISVMVRVDLAEGTVSLSLRNRSNDERFIWQDWVDAAMGHMKGFEESKKGELGYGRQIVRADLRRPMVELCPFYVNEDGIGAVLKKTGTARVWQGWPVFDVEICKFEMDQWLAASHINVNGVMEFEERWTAEGEIIRVKEVIEGMCGECQ